MKFIMSLGAAGFVRSAPLRTQLGKNGYSFTGGVGIRTIIRLTVSGEQV